MAERETTVIERMAKAYVTAKGHIVGGGKWLKSPPPDERMLAAVRELQAAIMERDGRCHRSIGEIISEHERRAGGKGE